MSMSSDEIIRKYLINAFACEFNIDFPQAEKIVTTMELFEILIERYWEEIYEKIKE